MIKSEITIHKVWRSEIHMLALFVGLSVACVILSHKIPALTVTGELFSVGQYQFYLSLPLLWLIPTTLLCMSIYKIYNVQYKVDNRGIESRIGRFAISQRVNRVRYEDIRAIDIHQTIFERMLDVGSIEVGTAASAESEVYMYGIDAPYEIKDMLERERDARLKKGGD